MRNGASLIRDADGGEDLPIRIRYPKRYAIAVSSLHSLAQQSQWNIAEVRDVATQVIVESNGNYTAWLRRLQCALAQPSYESAIEELHFTATIAQTNSKCYQLWNHRQQVISNLLLMQYEKYSDALQEMLALERSFTEQAIRQDMKHFHAWAHRIWACRLAQSWDNELQFLDELLTIDPYNNSVWVARLTVVSESGYLLANFAHELELASHAVSARPDNEAAWSYARGLFKHCTTEDDARLESLARSLLPYSMALRTLGRVLFHRNTADALAEACRVFECLATFDGTKRPFWSFKRDLACQMLAQNA